VAFILRSSAFGDGHEIPEGFTCDGANVAPPLAWSDPPEATRSFALIVDDPDAPGGTFTHWLVVDIPATARELGARPLGRALGNDFGRPEYGGPCPPPGRAHRYVFTLFAVDVAALSLAGESRESLERALTGHTLATARLTGRYQRRVRASAPPSGHPRHRPQPSSRIRR
jgi:Raf kinase inhibitor-like YbhB/YbcL family protein